MYRREFLKRAAAALAALTIVRPRKKVDHWYTGFIVPPDRTRTYIEREFIVPGLISHEREGHFDPKRRGEILQAMRQSPRGTKWLDRRTMARWGSHYDSRYGQVFAIEALIYA